MEQIAATVYSQDGNGDAAVFRGDTNRRPSDVSKCGKCDIWRDEGTSCQSCQFIHWVSCSFKIKF